MLTGDEVGTCWAGDRIGNRRVASSSLLAEIAADFHLAYAQTTGFKYRPRPDLMFG